MTRLPALGPHGEGWVLAQGVLLVAAALAGLLGPAWGGPARAATVLVGAVTIAAGLGLVVAGSVELRGALTPMPRPRNDAALVETGVYRHVRHPIYGGVVVATVGWGLATASPAALGIAGLLLGFFELKSRREEAWLETAFPGYAAYRARTPRLIPWPGGPRG